MNKNRQHVLGSVQVHKVYTSCKNN